MNSFILCLRALRNLRGFIHINLCTNLGIAQVIFIAGVDKTGGSSDHVPPHCKMVAVLLHYFFLATFMWMLMEGIFLYLTLVKVFLFKTKRYLMLFTVLSYGFPLLYYVIIISTTRFRTSWRQQLRISASVRCDEFKYCCL